MVMPARSHQVPNRIRSVFSAAGVPIHAVVEAEFFASLCGLVAAGAGWSIVDPMSARSFEHLGFVTRLLEPAVTYEIGAFHRRDRVPSVLAAAFLDMLDDKLKG